MAALRRLRRALALLLRRERLERELDEELRAFVDLTADEKRSAGHGPAQARRAALIELGGLEQVKEEVRDARAGAWILGLWRDLALALRGLRRAPALTAVVVLTLALGIGANSALFSVVHAVLLAPLPYPEPGRLFMIWSDLESAGYPRAPLSSPELQDFRDQSRLFQELGAIWATNAQLGGEAEPEQVRIGLVTARFFDVLGVPPALGRTFRPDEEGRPDANVILLSWALWQRRFGADPQVVGRAIRANGTSPTVVGVMPRDFRLLFPPDANVPEDLQAWVPSPNPPARLPRDLGFWRVVGRTAPGVSAAQAEDEIAAISRRIVPLHAAYAGAEVRFYARPLHQDAVREVRPALLALLAGVALLLAIACVNVANLLIARALGRRRETALRLALGAARRHLVRQCVAEGLVLSALGAAAGLGLARIFADALLRLRPAGFVRLDQVSLNLPALAFTAGIALASGLLFSLLPLRELLRVDLRTGLQQGGRAGGTLAWRTRAALVVAEVALGVVLLVGAGLMARTFGQLARVDPGFRPEGVLTFRLSLPPARYHAGETVNAFARDLERRLRALPGVTSVGAISHAPLDHLPNWSSPYLYDGSAAEASRAREADLRAVSPGLFEALGARIVAGRGFEEEDDADSRKVVIVDESLARRAWPGQDPIGQRLKVDFVSFAGSGFARTDATVVGVVRHLRHRTLAADVREQVYEPYRQAPRNPMAWMVRSRTDAATLTAAIRAEVQALDKELPVYDVRPLAGYVASALAPNRFVMLLAGVFAALAAALAALGTYGVIAYSVGQREQEFGVRRALGARSRDLMASVLREGVALAAAGLVLGAGAAALLTRPLVRQLYGISPADPLTYASVAAIQLLAVLLACWLPARRAAAADPLTALRVT